MSIPWSAHVLRSRRLNVLIILAIFILSRIALMVHGLRYQVAATYKFVQFMDLDLLRHHLVRVLWHLYGQPPLLNLLAGVAEKIAGAQFGWVMLSVQLVLAGVAFVAVYLTLIELEIDPRVALAVVLLLEFNPSEILFEFDALYTSLVASLVCLAAYAGVRCIKTSGARGLAMLASVALLLTLLRSYFQWHWIVLIFGILAWKLPEGRRRILRVGAITLLLSLLWPLKVYVQTGTFSSSTWSALSLSGHWDVIKHTKAQQFLREGRIPTFIAKSADGAANQNWYLSQPRPPATGYPEYDNLLKSVGGANLNTPVFLEIERRRRKDIQFLFRHDFGEYLYGTVAAVSRYVHSNSEYFSLPHQPPSELSQYAKLARYTYLVDRICCFPAGHFVADTFGPDSPKPSRGQMLREICVGVALLLLVNTAGLVLLVVWPRKLHFAKPVETFLAFLFVTIVYSFAATNLMERSENMRYRFEIQVLLMMVAVVLANAAYRRYRDHGEARSGINV